MMMETVLRSFNFAEVLNLIQHLFSPSPLTAEVAPAVLGAVRFVPFFVTVRGKSGILAPIP